MKKYRFKKDHTLLVGNVCDPTAIHIKKDTIVDGGVAIMGNCHMYGGTGDNLKRYLENARRDKALSEYIMINIPKTNGRTTVDSRLLEEINPKFKYKAFYINLDHREDRKSLMEKNWSSILELKHFPAIVSGTKGGHGNYASHRRIINYVEDFTIIMEDDIIPCSDFESRLDLFMKELPEDWDVFMLGFFASDRSRFYKVSEHLYKVSNDICASHCYVINPKSKDKILKEMDDPRNDRNIDVFLLNAQKYMNFYIPIPSLCYQYQSFSDNSNCNDDIVYKGTIKYFKDSL